MGNKKLTENNRVKFASSIDVDLYHKLKKTALILTLKEEKKVTISDLLEESITYVLNKYSQ